MNKSITHQIFIVGNAHSGTTLLKNILNNNDNTFTLNDETHFFSTFDQIKEVYNYDKNPDKLFEFVSFILNIIQKRGYQVIYNFDYKNNRFRLFKSYKEEANKIIEQGFVTHKNSHAKNFENTINYLAIQNNKSFRIEKSPFHIFHIDTIIKYISNPLFIEIVRDPRNIISSRKLRSKTHQEKYIILRDTLEWIKSVKAGLKYRKKYPDVIYTVTYENLIHNPKQTINNICSFLHLNFSDTMLDVEHIQKIP